MPQSTQTVLLRGGLNIVTPAIAVPPGMATAAMNYEPDVSGYRRLVGYERFDGQPSPSAGSDTADIAARRALIAEVPGTGPVRGVHVYDGALYAFRDTVGGEGRMWKSSASGWEEQTPDSYVVTFTTGTAQFEEGEVLVGGTSAATATIKRLVIRSGTFTGGDASGYLVVNNLTGTFQGEIGTSDSGSATLTVFDGARLLAGGRYDGVVHNFYGASKRPRLYFANGVDTAKEWDGEVLAPILTGNDAGPLDEISFLLAANGDFLLADNGDFLILDGEYDRPVHIGQFRNHLFLSFDAGSIINSGIGEPLDYRAIVGAAEIAFGSEITGFLTSASTAFVVFGQSRVKYITGNDSSDFLMLPISDRSGAVQWTAQMAGEQPMYLDEGGLRKLGTTSAFGDWRMGSVTQAVEPYFAAKKAAGAAAVATMTMRAKDQYYLFYDDGSGLVVYLGRKAPEAMPFKLPVTPFCACSGELDVAEGERHFIGCEDGFVYEMNRGTSFDGASVEAYIRLHWNTLGAPSQDKRFHKATVDVDTPDDVELGVAFAVDYAIAGNPGGAQQDIDVDQGSQSLIPFDDFASVNWSQATQGMVEAWLDGIGRSLGVTIVSEHTNEAPHVLQALTVNFSPRRMHR